MRWKKMRRSTNVEDRRTGRGRGGRMAIGGGLGTLIIALVVMLSGGDPMALLNNIDSTSASPAIGGSGQRMDGGPRGTQAPGEPIQDEAGEFVSSVLGSTEDVWRQVFQRSGGAYVEPKLVLFRDQVRSACGFASAASGPFYCPGDSKVYLDLSFFDELARRFGAPGDFAQAYVIAHEVGHHVQNLLGLTESVHRQKGRVSEREYNQLSVRLELQADFLAGVWAHHAQKTLSFLEEGDLEEALAAANAIGDDRLQKQPRGYVVPDSFTHGTSEQRQRWFYKGLRSGRIEDGDTFAAQDP